MTDNRNKIQSDNTRVVQKPIVLPIKHRLKPNEVFLTDRNTGEKILVKTPNARVYSGLNSPDNTYIVGTTQYKYGGRLIPHKNNGK